ncbi:hypothetical protein PIB30_071183 [Stylosanthes scabra]|uniref:Uncharacterized protein n=1 Tax=Stylosanthes scabra TaxID=79078 RepID=A0ABU6USE7_9FABA|nr:hypothetical protein [Stylosanthes scabra]
MEDENSSDNRKDFESKVVESPPDPSIPSFDFHIDSPTPPRPATPSNETQELDVDLDKLYEWEMDGCQNME